ncbi:DUF4333 domain-containing protein [Actinocorallia sp. B10E7]|uniref:DUF4333 domain-containing protein n=1 Tax=Actinocorallia sp. B10E7 TaxID=3153558 RepID=UPI00325E27B8
MSPIRHPGRSTRKRLALALSCTALLSGAITGCSVFGKVTERELERQIAEDLTGWFDGRPEVDCEGAPGDGREMRCSVITVQKDTWTVEATDVSNGVGRIDYEIRQIGMTSEIPRIEPYDLENQITEILGAELGAEPIDMDCDEPLKGVVGSVTYCKAHHYTGEKWIVHVEVTAVQGQDIKYKLHRTPAEAP